MAHTLAQYVGVVAKTDASSSSSSSTGGRNSRAAAATALIVPTLLTRASAEGKDAYPATSARLLEVAAADQQAFRVVVGGMSDGQRGFVEEVIRTGQQAVGEAGRAADGGVDAASGAGGGQPSIELKMDFGM